MNDGQLFRHIDLMALDVDNMAVNKTTAGASVTILMQILKPNKKRGRVCSISPKTLLHVNVSVI